MMAFGLSSGRHAIAMGAVLALLAGCVSYGGLTQETMAGCIREAGITGAYSASSSLRNDRMTFLVRPGPNVTDAQASIANACIARTIDGGQPGAPAAAAAPASSRPAPAVGSTCKAGGGVFQGGAGYCAR
jgi:hypothetical protein